MDVRTQERWTQEQIDDAIRRRDEPGPVDDPAEIAARIAAVRADLRGADVMIVGDDEADWSTRYYVADCPDIQITVLTDGPDDRPDPTEDGATCLIREHGVHRLTRVSPAVYDRLRFGVAVGEDTDDDDDDDEDGDDLVWLGEEAAGE